MADKGNLYGSEFQANPGSVCNLDGQSQSGTRARKASERFQRGAFVFTNTAGELTLATTQLVTLFQYGYLGDASGAGWPSGALFQDSETNVSNDNGLNNVRIISASVEIERAHYVTSPGASYVVGGGVELADYQEEIVSLLGSNMTVRLQIGPQDNAVTFALGNALRNPSMRGRNDLNAYGSHATPAVPMLLREPIDVPAASGTNRPFAAILNAARALSLPSRPAPATANVYVPVTVSFEIAQLGG